MRKRYLIALAVLGLAAGLAVRFPLSAAMSLSGARGAALDWRAAEGPVWGGAVRGLTLHDYPVGDVRAALSPLSVLALSPSAAVTLTGPEASAQGRIGLRPGGALRIADADATLYLTEISAIDPRLRVRGGVLTAQGLDLTLRGGRCLAASGALASDALTYGFGGEWRGPSLAGEVSCADGLLVLPLAGAAEGDEVEAAARLGAGAYRFEALVRSPDEGLARIAPLLGFAEYGEGWRYEWSFAP